LALHRPDLALLPHGLGIDRRPHDFQRVWIDSRQQVQIDEAVIQGRQQGVGPGVREPRQVRVAARRIDHDHVGSTDHLLERCLEARLLVSGIASCGNCAMLGDRQIEAFALGVCSAVLDVARKCALAGVEVDGRDPRAVAEQRHDDVHRGRRLARTALLVADHQHVRSIGSARRLVLNDRGIGGRREGGRRHARIRRVS
jgi:hypothetical protein